MPDPYLIPNTSVLRNKFGITEDKLLDIAESTMSRGAMSLLAEQGLAKFSAESLKHIHGIIFSEVYDWAGGYRSINIQKREELLGGRSVWYTNADNIETELESAWQKIESIEWKLLEAEEFALSVARYFPQLWQIHPFREGNTRSLVMLIHLFTEHYGYYFDQDLFANSAKYVRNAFVMASLDKFSEFEHLEHILVDTISEDPFSEKAIAELEQIQVQQRRYSKYRPDAVYKTIPHELRGD